MDLYLKKKSFYYVGEKVVRIARAMDFCFLTILYCGKISVHVIAY